MTTDTWQTIGTIVALLLVGAYNAWQSRKAEREARLAKSHAAVASAQTIATGNGFAGNVLERLDRIERRGDETHTLMVNHLASHSDRDLSGGHRA